MHQKQITLQFDLDDANQQRIYEAIMNLPEFYKEDDLTRALMVFINNLVASLNQCEKKRAQCEQVLRALGLPASQASRLVHTFRDHDVKRLHDSHASHDDEERMRYLAMESARELETLFAEDEADEDLAR